ncbi:MAG: YdcH family protein [Burkholderiaceae bacterium]
MMFSWVPAMTPDDPDAIKQRIVELQLEHRGLDQMISTASDGRALDDLQLRRLKKRKLQIKDMILALQMRLVPDIPA